MATIGYVGMNIYKDCITGAVLTVFEKVVRAVRLTNYYHDGRAN